MSRNAAKHLEAADAEYYLACCGPAFGMQHTAESVGRSWMIFPFG